jgi:flagellar motor switch protein FliN/FliY
MSDESKQISQDEIDRLLSQPKPPRPAATGGAVPPPQQDPSAAGQQGFATSEPESPTFTGAPVGTASPPLQSTAGHAYQPSSSALGSVGSSLPTSDIDFLFRQAEQALASVDGPQPTPPGVSPFKLVDFGGAPASTESATLDLLRDVELDLKIELGRTHMYLEDVLRLSKGAVVPLDRLAGDPVDIYVNGRLIARGEVLILNDNFCVRVAELMTGETAGAAT